MRNGRPLAQAEQISLPPLPSSRFYDEKSETLPLKTLSEIQWQNLKKIVKIAYDYCPLYHRLFRENNLYPDDLRNIEDYRRKVPRITKDDLRKQIEIGDYTSGIFPTNLIPENICLTSGYSGQNTFLVFTNQFLENYLEKMSLREFWMVGLRPSMRVLITSSPWHFFGIFLLGVMRKMGTETFFHEGTQIPRFARAYREILRISRPEYLMITPSFLSTAANLFEEEDEGTSSDLFRSVKIVHVAGEPILQPSRKRIMDRIGIGDIYESGGSVDGLWGGAECYTHSGHHSWMDNNFLELVDSKSGEILPLEDQSKRGSLVSTSLSTGSSIFLRFDTKDLGTINYSPCECGRTHPRVEILDRITNLIHVGGKEISLREIEECVGSDPLFANSIFTVFRSKSKKTRLRMSITVSSDLKPKDEILEERLQQLISEQLGIEVEVEVVKAESLPFLPMKLIRVIDEE